MSAFERRTLRAALKRLATPQQQDVSGSVLFPPGRRGVLALEAERLPAHVSVRALTAYQGVLVCARCDGCGGRHDHLVPALLDGSQAPTCKVLDRLGDRVADMVDLLRKEWIKDHRACDRHPLTHALPPGVDQHVASVATQMSREHRGRVAAEGRTHLALMAGVEIVGTATLTRLILTPLRARRKPAAPPQWVSPRQGPEALWAPGLSTGGCVSDHESTVSERLRSCIALHVPAVTTVVIWRVRTQKVRRAWPPMVSRDLDVVAVTREFALTGWVWLPSFEPDVWGSLDRRGPSDAYWYPRRGASSFLDGLLVHMDEAPALTAVHLPPFHGPERAA